MSYYYSIKIKPCERTQFEVNEVLNDGVLEMFKKQTVDNTEKNRILTEGKLMDNLCELAVERHFQQFFKTSSKFRFSNESTDQITVIVCEALVKDLENEIWQRIAPKMSDRVIKMRELAMEATGGHKHI